MTDRITSAVAAINKAFGAADPTATAVAARIEEAEKRRGRPFTAKEKKDAEARVLAAMDQDTKTVPCLIALPADTNGVRDRSLELPDGRVVAMKAGDKPTVADLTERQAVELARTGFAISLKASAKLNNEGDA